MVPIKLYSIVGAILLHLLLPTSDAFTSVNHVSNSKLNNEEGTLLRATLGNEMMKEPADDGTANTSRRAFVSTTAAIFAGISSALTLEPAHAAKEEEKVVVVEEEAPPDSPRVLVLGGTGTIGKEVMKKMATLGMYAIATSRDGREDTIAFDVLEKKTGVIDAITELANDKRITAVISCIGAIDPQTAGSINGASALAAIGAKKAKFVKNFVFISISPDVRKSLEKDDDLKDYFSGKAFSEQTVEAQFKGDGYSYTIIQPSAIESKPQLVQAGNPIPAQVVANAAIVGAIGYSEKVLDTNGKIESAAKEVETILKKT